MNRCEILGRFVDPKNFKSPLFVFRIKINTKFCGENSQSKITIPCKASLAGLLHLKEKAILQNPDTPRVLPSGSSMCAARPHFCCCSPYVSLLPYCSRFLPVCSRSLLYCSRCLLIVPNVLFCCSNNAISAILNQAERFEFDLNWPSDLKKEEGRNVIISWHAKKELSDTG